MQSTKNIQLSSIETLIDSIFKELAIVYQSDSEFGKELGIFESENELSNDIFKHIESGSAFTNYAIFYPVANGYFHKKRASLDPKHCDGFTYRYSASGWGLIQLQLDFQLKTEIEIRLAVNSRKRANSWKLTCPELKEPDLWNWKYIEKHTRRLIRVLKQCP